MIFFVNWAPDLCLKITFHTVCTSVICQTL